jgi:hypothetical protein
MLAWFTVVWNVIEAVVALAAGSVACYLGWDSTPHWAGGGPIPSPD